MTPFYLFRKKYLWILLLLGGLFLFSPTFLFSSFSKLFDWKLEETIIEGNTHTPRQTIIDTMGIKSQTNLSNLPLETLRQKLTALPWVEKVALYRQPPHSLHVRLQEYVPIAILQTKESYALVDQDLHLINVSFKDLQLYRTLPVLVGEKTLSVFPSFYQLLKSYPLISVHIQTIEFLRGHLWQLTTYSHTRILLPPLETEKALKMLNDVQNNYNVLGGNAIEIDLRIPNRFFMTPVTPPARVLWRQKKLRQQ